MWERLLEELVTGWPWSGEGQASYRRGELAEGARTARAMQRQLGLWGGHLTNLCVPWVTRCWRGGKERPGPLGLRGEHLPVLLGMGI